MCRIYSMAWEYIMWYLWTLWNTHHIVLANISILLEWIPWNIQYQLPIILCQNDDQQFYGIPQHGKQYWYMKRWGLGLQKHWMVVTCGYCMLLYMFPTEPQRSRKFHGVNTQHHEESLQNHREKWVIPSPTGRLIRWSPQRCRRCPRNSSIGHRIAGVPTRSCTAGSLGRDNGHGNPLKILETMASHIGSKRFIETWHDLTQHHVHIYIIYI